MSSGKKFSSFSPPPPRPRVHFLTDPFYLHLPTCKQTTCYHSKCFTHLASKKKSYSVEFSSSNKFTLRKDEKQGHRRLLGACRELYRERPWEDWNSGFTSGTKRGSNPRSSVPSVRHLTLSPQEEFTNPSHLWGVINRIVLPSQIHMLK